MKSAPALNQVFDWRGHQVRYGAFGDGPAVVLCHGTPWSSFVWRTTIEALSQRWSVFVWDMLGYGQSDKPDSDISLVAQADLLASLVQYWQIQRPHLIAHDIGGAVALRAHLLHGVDVASFALVDIVALRPWGSPFFNLVREHPHVFAALPANLHRALVAEYIAGASSRGLQPEVLEELVSPWMGTGQQAFYRQIAQASESQTEEIEHLFAQIDVPTMIIWGADDTWIPPDRAARLEALIPASAATIIAGAGHLVQEDEPQLLNRLLVDWLPA